MISVSNGPNKKILCFLKCVPVLFKERLFATVTETDHVDETEKGKKMLNCHRRTRVLVWSRVRQSENESRRMV